MLLSEQTVRSRLLKINVKKATGWDNIPPKILKIGANVLARPITFLINKSVDTNTFPDALKYAEVWPVYKKDDPLDKSNYRPVSVLPCLSKL